MQQKQLTCPLCAATTLQEISTLDRRGAPLITDCCLACGLVFSNPLPTEADLVAFYTTDYRKNYKKTINPKLKHHYRYAGRVVREITPHLSYFQKAETVLDIGCGSGEFVALMQAFGKKAFGVEPSLNYAKYIQNTFDVSVFTGSLDDYQPTQSFDLIRMSHVLEHMRDPIEKLKKVRSLLTENGALFLEVPNFRQYCQTKSPGNIFHYGHIYNFDRQTLGAVCSLAGLETIEALGDTRLILKKGAMTAPEWHADNASQNLDVYRKHQSGAFTGVHTKTNKLFGKISRMTREYRFIAQHNTPQKIIGHFASQLAPS
ncbi:MAG: class I SAM-dependent methyltransferase [Rhodospirillaceae bacterium]